VNAFLRHPLAKTRLSDLTTGAVSAYSTERLARVRPSSLNRELDILRHTFNVVKRNWDVPLSTNLFAEVTRPALCCCSPLSKPVHPRVDRIGPGDADASRRTPAGTGAFKPPPRTYKKRNRLVGGLSERHQWKMV
jgi:hypothetical protein